jgi:hypothetical protein
MRILFLTICGIILLFPQMILCIKFAGCDLNLGLITVLVIYAGFSFPFLRGFIAVIIISFILEAMSFVTHGSFILAHLMVYVSIAFLENRIFSEAYTTKSLWVFIFSLINQCLFALTYQKSADFLGSGFFWLEAFFQALIQGVVSFPLFIFLDIALDKWMLITSRPRANLTGVDFFQAKSKQRRYL